MTVRFPPITPYATGTLPVGDGHALYWECSGNPAGRPALYLHGGPGTGCGNGARRYFDPAIYRIVLFDQRGCGRSRPLASDVDTTLHTNTTAHLIADIERLRTHLEVERWTILGVSWGTTLGLAYAQTHPERVAAVALALLTTTSHREVEWMTRDLGRLFPQQWERFVATVPQHLRGMRVVDAYATLLFDDDPRIQARAASEWCAWDNTQSALIPQPTDPRFDDAAFRLRFARLVTHYWRNAAFLEEDQLHRDAAKLNGIPGVLVHGRYDVSCPLDTAWRLSQVWTSSRLHIIESGHGDDAAFPLAVTAAMSDLAAG